MKQVLPDLFVHPSPMCSAFVCLLKFLLVLPTAEGPLHLHNLTLQCKLKPPNILDLLPSAAVNIHSIYPLCWSSHTYTGCFTGHFYLSLAKAFSCMHLISTVYKSHTISHQLTFSSLLCISSVGLFQHPIYLKISFHIPLWVLNRSL